MNKWEKIHKLNKRKLLLIIVCLQTENILRHKYDCKTSSADKFALKNQGEINLKIKLTNALHNMTVCLISVQ